MKNKIDLLSILFILNLTFSSHFVMMAETKVINIVDDSDEFDTYNGQEYHPILSSHNDINPTEDLNSILRESTEDPLLEEVVVDNFSDSDKNNFTSQPESTITYSENNLKEESKKNIKSSGESESATLSLDNKQHDSIVIEEVDKTNSMPFSLDKDTSTTTKPTTFDLYTTTEPSMIKTETVSEQISNESTSSMVTEEPDFLSTSTIKTDNSIDVIATTEQVLIQTPSPVNNTTDIASSEFSYPDTKNSVNSLKPDIASSVVTNHHDTERDNSSITEKEVVEPLLDDNGDVSKDKPPIDKPIVVEISKPDKIEVTTQSPPPTTTEAEEPTTVYHNSRISSFSSLLPAVEANDSHIRPSKEPVVDFEESKAGFDIITFEMAIYTVFVLFCVTLWIIFKRLFSLDSINKDISPSQTSPASAKIINDVEKKRECLENIKQNLDLDNDTNLRVVAERLKGENQKLLRKLELQKKLKPIRSSIRDLQNNILGDYQTMINNRKIYNQKLKTLQNSAKKNMDLKNKIEVSKYEQLRLIKNLVSLENLLDVMRGVEFQERSNNLKQSTFEAKIEIEFLKEQVETFDKLSKQFIREYEELSKEISIEKEIELSREKEYRELRKELILLKENTDSIDEWKRKISLKMNKAYEYYRNYIFDYYKVQAYIEEQQISDQTQNELQVA